jgi:endonuclease/exonuclease/phosphatase family metal-dependent hydrolase
MQRKQLWVSFSLYIVTPILICLSNPSISDAEDKVRVGAWNIEWLGFPDKRSSFGRNTPQKPSTVAKYIHDSKVDILALEEIGIESLEKPYTSKPLQAVMEALKKEYKQDWEYILFPKTDYPEDTEDFLVRGQHCGVAWRTDKVSQVGEVYAIPIEKNETFGQKFFERRANAVKFSLGSSKTDLVVIPVHLKSNRTDDKEKDPNYTAKQRQAELTSFVNKLETLKTHFKDEDIVLLGDTNIMTGETKTSGILINAGFMDLNQMEDGTTVAWGKSKYPSAPFDRVFVPKGQPEFKVKSQITHKPTDVEKMKDHRRQLSDHYLVSVDVAVMDDDD